MILNCNGVPRKISSFLEVKEVYHARQLNKDLRDKIDSIKHLDDYYFDKYKNQLIIRCQGCDTIKMARIND